ncbi:hypothetical protein CCACVL1_29220 [Corchorus capsularis]|uniref:Uncharacterized protein n=1 Tax=Corchorus capsularis TaxID=210143 RepID=A0A1R3G365_COCAP|nr:hypothetical protein CCACVL1_29220 [Corchorus capsularis]
MELPQEIEPVNPPQQFPAKQDLPYVLRQLIGTLEDLLCIRCPALVPRNTLETRGKPILIELSKLVVGYHLQSIRRHRDVKNVIFRWLSIAENDIP